MKASAWRHGARIVRAHPITFTLAILLYLLFYTLPLGTGLVTRAVFDTLSGKGLPGLDVWTLIGFLVGVEASRLVVIFFAAWSFNTFHYAVESLLRGNMLGWLVAAPSPQILPASAGEAMTRFRDDVNEVNTFLEAWIDLSGQMVFAIVAFSIMLSINGTITLVVIVPMVLIATITYRLTDRIQLYRRLTREATGRVTSFIAELLGAAQAVRVAGAEERVVALLDDLNDARKSTAIRDRLFAAVMESFSANTAGLGLGLILLLSAGAMRRGDFTVGDFTLFASYIGWAAAAPRWVGRLLTRQQQTGVSIERMDQIMGGAAPLALTTACHHGANVPDGRADVEALRSLTVSGLTYLYPGSSRGVEDVDLTLRRGTLTVVTGRVGAGKTTLLRALLGLVPATARDFRWNDQSVEVPAAFMAPPRSAYTSQAPRLFSETLRDNILMGRRNSDDEIRAALRFAILEDDLPQLGGGLDTIIGTRGVTLSGGQVQRAAVARMIVREPQLIVIDDASSALDVRTERLFWQQLLDERRHTYLAVSHRAEAYRRADEIIVLEEGRVVARGSLAFLLQDSPAFRDIWETMSDGGRPEVAAAP